MQGSWQTLSKRGWLGFALGLMGGCASYQPSAQVLPDFKPRDAAPAVAEMASAHRQGQVEFISAGGAAIPVRVFGTNGSRRPVMMTHGLESHSGWFVQSAAFLARLGHPVYLVDRRGSGLSRERRGDSDNFHQWSEELESVARLVLSRHRAERLHVMGHCFGAIPATVFTLEHSNLVASLILPTPGFVTTTDLTFWQKLHVLGDRLSRNSHYLPVPLQTEEFSDLEPYRDFIRQDELKLREATTAFYWNVNGARKLIRAHRREVHCPVWVGLAGKDEIIRAGPTRELVADFPSSQKQIAIFPEAKHILEFSAERGAFFSELESWLKRCEE